MQQNGGDKKEKSPGPPGGNILSSDATAAIGSFAGTRQEGFRQEHMGVKKQKGEPKESVSAEAASEVREESVDAVEVEKSPSTENQSREEEGAVSEAGIFGDFPQDRLDQIKESHELLKQFTAKELKTLLNLKRNTSPKAWTVREDLVVLTLAKSNREIAEFLKDRNKEAVKKRLQLLKSKGLTKRAPESPPSK